MEETAKAMQALFDAGNIRAIGVSNHPVMIDYRPSFVDGIGGKTVFPAMFERAKRLLDGSLVASLDETGEALRLLAGRNRVIAEGAGACPVACALAGRAGPGKVVCVVSGGNIDFSKLCKLLTLE